jgi:hypothetical protein
LLTAPEEEAFVAGFLAVVAAEAFVVDAFEAVDFDEEAVDLAAADDFGVVVFVFGTVVFLGAFAIGDFVMSVGDMRVFEAAGEGSVVHDQLPSLCLM